jgi:signal transduction histidine kinase
VTTAHAENETHLARFREVFSFGATLALSLGPADMKPHEFIAFVIHDIRNPIGAALANLGFMRDHLPGASNDVTEALDDVDDAVRRVSSLIDELMSVSMFDAGSLPVRREPFDLSALVRDVEQATRREVELRKLKVVLEPSSQEHTLNGDRTLVRRMIENMLAYTFRETLAGGTVTILIRTHASNGAEIEIAGSGNANTNEASLSPRVYFSQCIAEAHGGSLTRVERQDHTAIIATLPPK